ncbi:hypothetical protein HY947_05125 [Candidatus Gottesmanbacteria bacterium]|nr:hypothetical protein [Candidatus Gottesmanbacteria bacterium]
MYDLTLRDAVLVAVSYSDIFSYPLTIEELIRFLPYRSDASRIRIQRVVNALHLLTRDGFITFSKASGYIALRKKRDTIAQRKWNIVYSVLWIFRYIPTVRLVAVTGALSMNNVEKKDDIDLLVIAEGKSVWITRFIVTFLFDVFGIRRKPNQRHVSNLFCLNMYLSSDALEIPKEKRNFYIAHEIVQMVPVFDRKNTYNLFCQKNLWVRDMLPHALKRVQIRTGHTRIGFGIVGEWVQQLFFTSMEYLDVLFMRVQLLYMKTRHTREVVLRDMIRFHPFDANEWVYKKLAIRLRRKKIPLDKIFFSH